MNAYRLFCQKKWIVKSNKAKSLTNIEREEKISLCFKGCSVYFSYQEIDS
jgi:hypothetical protein